MQNQPTYLEYIQIKDDLETNRWVHTILILQNPLILNA